MPGGGRYDAVATSSVEVPDGLGSSRNVRFLVRRWPGPASTQPALARHRVATDDRLDLISARYLGDPLAWWRICDANDVLDPDALVDSAAEGTIVTIPVPGV